LDNNDDIIGFTSSNQPPQEKQMIKGDNENLFEGLAHGNNKNTVNNDDIFGLTKHKHSNSDRIFSDLGSSQQHVTTKNTNEQIFGFKTKEEQVFDLQNSLRNAYDKSSEPQVNKQKMGTELFYQQLNTNIYHNPMQGANWNMGMGPNLNIINQPYGGNYGFHSPQPQVKSEKITLNYDNIGFNPKNEKPKVSETNTKNDNGILNLDMNSKPKSKRGGGSDPFSNLVSFKT